MQLCEKGISFVVNRPPNYLLAVNKWKQVEKCLLRRFNALKQGKKESFVGEYLEANYTCIYVGNKFYELC